jgi:hypothetical protein
VSPDELDRLYDSDDRRAPRESDEEAAAERGKSAIPRVSDKQRALEARIAERRRLTAKAAPMSFQQAFTITALCPGLFIQPGTTIGSWFGTLPVPGPA